MSGKEVRAAQNGVARESGQACPHRARSSLDDRAGLTVRDSVLTRYCICLWYASIRGPGDVVPEA
jgi:hypothetical protein